MIINIVKYIIILCKYVIICIPAIIFILSLFQSKVAFWIFKSEEKFKNKIFYLVLCWLFINCLLFICSYRLFRKKINYNSQKHSWTIIRDYIYFFNSIGNDVYNLEKILKPDFFNKNEFEKYIKNKSGVLLNNLSIQLLEIIMRITKEDQNNFKILYKHFKNNNKLFYNLMSALFIKLFPNTNILKLKHDYLLLFNFSAKHYKKIALKSQNFLVLFESDYLISLINDVREIKIDDKNEADKIEKLLNQINKTGIMVYSLSIMSNQSL